MTEGQEPQASGASQIASQQSQSQEQDFWRDSGYHLLDRAPSGRLLVTDNFLRAYLLRPEVAPVAESCDAELALHQALLDNPRRKVTAEDLKQLADPDAVEGYQIVLGFRDRLLAAPDLESAYQAFFTGPPPQGEPQAPVPPLFLDQLAQIILRNILRHQPRPLQLRAAELLFRDQQITLQESHAMAADEEVVSLHARNGGLGDLGQLVVEAGTQLKAIELDVLTEENAGIYWERNQRYDTVLNLGFAGAGLDALCRVLEKWVAHFLSVEVSIQPVQEISDQRWVWHLGLDAEGSRLLNDLYNGKEPGEAQLARLLSLFRLEFKNPADMRPDIAGRPVYLALSMTPDKKLKVKPQNLLVNLPLASRN
ncbi:DUF6352 family protein [Rhodovibrionaceae bacterium A322]